MSAPVAPVYSRLFSRGMVAVLVAQFLSALADNALFVAAIALLKNGIEGEQLIPWLQEAFVVAYILLAPFVGPFADSQPKGRVMFISNLMKFCGAGMMFAGMNPLFGYLLVGVGAAAYSPAKYGILTQFFGPETLVRANGLLESSTIVAILLGVIAGGWMTDHSLSTAFVLILALYLLAALANLLIPRLPPEHRAERVGPVVLVVDFWKALAKLWRDRDARFCIVGTSVFWGTGSTLRLLLFAWVPVALSISDNQTPAMMMGAVSVGIILGAALAAWLVKLRTVNRAMLGGVLIGPLVMLLAPTHDLYLAVGLLVLIGVCGGFFVVPLNALLQERGHALVGAGHALAIQNFWENAAILVFIGAYMSAGRVAMPVTGTVTMFGAVVLSALLVIGTRRLVSTLARKAA
jgi:LPLT family lysophospholipid transporter-like MFS transporter